MADALGGGRSTPSATKSPIRLTPELAGSHALDGHEAALKTDDIVEADVAASLRHLALALHQQLAGAVDEIGLDGQAGHGVGSTAQQGHLKQADIYSFLLWQFGQARQSP